MRRRDFVVLMAGAVLTSSLVTWLAAAQIRSPAEVAARTAPPEPSLITVPVEERVLSNRVVTRGTAHFGSPQQVRLHASRLKSGAGVVTTLVRPGQRLRAGDLLGTVAGRPVFVLAGSLPSYRDLGPGTTGVDVRQVEASLRKLGLRPGPVDGRFDTATGAALARLYGAHGHQPVVATEQALSRVRPPEAALLPGAAAGPGVQLPSDEVVYLPRLPVRVSELHGRLGSPAEGPLLEVTGSDVVIDAMLPVEQAGRVEAGDRVLVDEPALGVEAQGRVSHIAGRPGTGDADAFHVAFQVTVAEPPPALVGASVRLTIPVRSTRTARLAVPVSAVSLGPDGGSRVEKAAAGESRFVPVETGFSADGYVVVAPRGTDLEAGDRVVVGRRTGGG